MAYTFSDLKTECKAVLWPNGTPENLEAAIDKFFTEALIELQKYVPCLRVRHESVFAQCSTYFKCGTTWFEAPRGRITKVYVTQGNYCQPVTYQPTSYNEVLCWSRRFTEIVTSPANTGMPTIPEGFLYPEATSDARFGRALTGFWALETRGQGARIVLAPWLQSDETVTVEWSGTKLAWSDSDPVLDDPELKKAVRMYVRWAYEDNFICDRVQTAAVRATYDDALAEMIYTCREETRQRPADPCNEETRSLYATYVAPTTPVPTADPNQMVFAALGDYGMNNAPELAVANLVKGWGPEFIIALGDNNYPDGAADTIDENVGQYFHEYIYPYTGSYTQTSGITENAFWPVLGNHDLDTDDGAPYSAYFPAPISARFYDRVIGNVHLFMVDSGFNTAGDLVEPAGNDPASAQAAWLQARLAQSTAKWKIVCFHHAPYTNSTSYSPGTLQLRWPFKSWGADIVLSGHAHNTEFLTVDDLPYVVSGAGGAALTGFIADPVNSDYRYSADYAALKLTSTCDTLTVEAYNTAGSLLYTLSLP